MLKRKQLLTAATVILIAITATIAGCKKDSSAPATTTYQLKAKQNGVAGTITFTQTSSSMTTIDITLTGGSSSSHPAFLRNSSAAEGGNKVVTLSDVINGKSSTNVSALDNGTAETYAQLIAYDGFIQIQESDVNSTAIAVSDIGGNVLTGTSKTYRLDTAGAYGISGNIVIAKRNNGNALATITVTNILDPNATYDAQIRLGTVSTIGGPVSVAKTLTPVTASGVSETTIKTYDTGGTFNYDVIVAYTGYVVLIDQSTGNIVCKGNIGN